jgi:hypothetical protein
MKAIESVMTERYNVKDIQSQDQKRKGGRNNNSKKNDILETGLSVVQFFLSWIVHRNLLIRAWVRKFCGIGYTFNSVSREKCPSKYPSDMFD